MKKLIITTLIILPLVLTLVNAQDIVCVYLFYGKNCPHCAQEKNFLDSLSDKYPVEIHDFEIYFDNDNRKLFEEVSEAYSTKMGGVPMTFIGDKAFVGFSEGNTEMFDEGYNAYIGYSGLLEKTIREYSEQGGVNCPLKNEHTTTSQQPETTTTQENTQTTIDFPVTPIENKTDDTVSIPIFGEMSLNLPIPLIGMILGVMDGGFNPCALSVLFFLVAYLMTLGSKKKTLSIGLTFSLVVFLVYFSFMYGIINVISVVGYLGIIKRVVSVVIILAGIIEIKDFFFYGKWFSLEIPKFAKPVIERLVKSATIPSAIVLGFFVSLVEIPCAGAFPFIYLTMLAERVSGGMVVVYLLWYNVFFVLPLITLTTIFYLGWMKVEKAEESRLKARKWMRLMAGLIMIILGLAMFFRVI